MSKLEDTLTSKGYRLISTLTRRVMTIKLWQREDESPVISVEDGNTSTTFQEKEVSLL